MRSFARDTAVEPDGSGRFTGAVADGWDIAGNANGGYLLALAARAAVAATGKPDPVSVTAHYLSPGRPGPVVLDTEVVRSGRRFATSTVALSAEGRPVVQLLALTGDLGGDGSGAGDGDEAAPSVLDGAPPELPAPEDCRRRQAPSGVGPSGFDERVEVRIHPDDAGFADGHPSGSMRVRGWFRLEGGEPLDTLAVLLASDSFPPAVFNGGVAPGWVPTLQLTTHVRARPAPGWLRGTFATRFVSGGFLEEDGELWDSSGRLVAQSRQLALVPRR